MAVGDQSYNTPVYLERDTGMVKNKATGCGSFCERVRATVAQVNAGLTLIPAIPGRTIRLMHLAAIAIGGNAGAVTTVDVKSTQATSAVTLFSFAQANLTRSTYLGPGITGCTILADGASFVANDAGAAVTAIKGGADITTATHIDFVFSFAIE